MTKKLQFTLKVEKALRELAGLPWEFTHRLSIRCEGACPVQVIWEANTGQTEEGNSAHYHIQTDFPGSVWQWRAVIAASDFQSHPLRARLCELLDVV